MNQEISGYWGLGAWSWGSGKEVAVATKGQHKESCHGTALCLHCGSIGVAPETGDIWLRSAGVSVHFPVWPCATVMRRFPLEETGSRMYGSSLCISYLLKFFFPFFFLPWLVWLSELGISLQTKRSPVWFLVSAHAWVASWGPHLGGCERQLINAHRCFSPSLSPSLPLSLKINK